MAMTRNDIVQNFTANPDDGVETADIYEFLDVSSIFMFYAHYYNTIIGNYRMAWKFYMKLILQFHG